MAPLNRSFCFQCKFWRFIGSGPEARWGGGGPERKLRIWSNGLLRWLGEMPVHSCYAELRRLAAVDISLRASYVNETFTSKLQKIGLSINARNVTPPWIGDPTANHAANELKLRATVRLMARNEHPKEIPLLIGEIDRIFHRSG
jgi:hypothetical protein